MMSGYKTYILSHGATQTQIEQLSPRHTSTTYLLPFNAEVAPPFVAIRYFDGTGTAHPLYCADTADGTKTGPGLNKIQERIYMLS